MDDRPTHWLLLGLFLATLVAVAALLPAVKVLTDVALTRSQAFHKVLKFRPGVDGAPGTYDMGRVARRLLMVTAFAMLLGFRKRLRIVDLAAIGLRRGKGWTKELAQGTVLGVGSLSAYLVLLALLGAWRVEPNSKAVAVVLGKSLTAGAGVGLVEEVLFRGFLLHSLAVSLGAAWAIVWTSAFYSILHFFKAKALVCVGFDPLIGVKTIGSFFAPVLREPAILLDRARWDESIVPGTVGLFLVGAVLGYAFVRTRRLYVSIGLHAGWVFVLKCRGLFLHHSGGELRWLYGDKDVVTGVMGWAFLIALWAVLSWTLRRGTADAGGVCTPTAPTGIGGETKRNSGSRT